MGILNLEEESYHRNKIKQALKKRGLRMDMDCDWEIHGPHPDVPVVYVGYAYYDKWHPHQHMPKERRVEGTWVAIYPRAVYEIEEADKWCQVEPEKRILIFNDK